MTSDLQKWNLVYDYFDPSWDVFVGKIFKNDIKLSGNTSNMKQHLRCHHMNVYDELISKDNKPTLSLLFDCY